MADERPPRFSMIRSFALADIVTPSATMALRFVARDGGFITAFDAAVDDVEFGDGLVLSAGEGGPAVPTAWEPP